MARLAAYYQEDFHYPFSGPAGHQQQRKSSYVVYEEPKNNMFNSYSFNKERIRALATSEPSLDFPQMPPDAMAVQRRVYHPQGPVYQNYPHPYANISNMPHSNQYFVRHGPEVYDNESIFSYNELPQHDNQRHRGRSRKRFSYAEPVDLYSPDVMYIPHNGQRHHIKESQEDLSFQYNDAHYLPDNYFIEPISQCQSTPLHFRPESRQEHWQKHHFIQTSANPVFLSPPSPLDSGLSSQSIGSNPSLDAEHSSEHLPGMKSGRHSSCSCTRLPHCDNRRLNGRDFGEMSPIPYPVSQRMVPQRKHKRSTSNRRKHHTEDYDVSPHCENQVRYGKLGLVGEPTDNQQLDHNRQQECKPKEYIHYAHSDESDVIEQRTPNHRRKKTSSSNFARPCVIVIDGPKKNNRPPSSSPDNREELSDDKSQGPESPMSVTVSNSDSAPSSLEQEEPKRSRTPLKKRRSSMDRSAEFEIRELEAMYARCNLGDRDLLDRAERRDLPTVHQQSVRLSRSRSSDALCETSLRGNPYEPLRRAPPMRRSGMPDRIADDMANRKLQRIRHRSNLVDNTITYMLCSAHFTPPMQPPADRDVLLLANPDVELDDLCYRKHYLGKEGKQDPEPPFGIPLRPPPTQKVSINDYLHVVPSQVPRPLCHPRGNPDVVRDDMAFRTLRKDEPDRVYYDMSQIYRHKKI